MGGASGAAVRTETLHLSGGRSRILVRLDREGARRYAGAVTPVVDAIERALGPEVLAARVRRASTAAGASVLELAPWRPARRRFHAAADRLAADSAAVVITDVRACYASIENHALASRLLALGCGRRDVDRVLQILDAFHDAGVPGLPVGPAPSAALANAVLSAVDAAVAAPGVRHLRWVDDVMVFTRDEGRARSALGRIEDVLAGLGMRPAGEKTRLIDPRGTTWRASCRLSMSPSGPPADRPL